MILILTGAGDPHADYVEEQLLRRGAEVVRFDPGQFPAQADIAVAYGSAGRNACALRFGDQCVDLLRVESVWYRRPSAPAPHPEIQDQVSREYVAEECKRFVYDVWESLDCRWLPARPAAIHRAALKGSQLAVAATLGFELPPTLITNSTDRFLEFYRQHNGNIVSKLASPAFGRTAGKTFSRYTEVVSKRDVGYAQSIRFAPVIFQAYVPKRLEIRVTVVGDRVFAAEIHSQTANRTRHDWRRYDLEKTLHQPHDLPPSVAEQCARLVAELGLCYGAIDLVLTPDDRYVFLELNPNGQYLWIERMTELPITDAICDLLMAGPDDRTACPTHRTDSPDSFHVSGFRKRQPS